METLGDRIKRLREAKGLSQNELAKKAGLSQSGLSSLENETKSPTIQTVGLVAKALGVTTADLLGETAAGESKTLPEDYEVYDEEAQALMREMYERPELRALFKTSRRVKPEDIKAVDDLLRRMAGQDYEDTP